MVRQNNLTLFRKESSNRNLLENPRKLQGSEKPPGPDQGFPLPED